MLLKQLFIAVMLLATAAATASAQASHDSKTLAAVPVTTSSPHDNGISPISALQERPDTGQSLGDAPGGMCHPESAHPDCVRKGRSLIPDPTPTPTDETPAATDGESGRASIPDSDTAPHSDTAGGSPEEPDEVPEADTRFRWRAAAEQSLLFLAVQHGYALTQPKTRRDLRGSFFRDYARSVRSLHGWGDGGKFFTNYVAHPMQGSLMGFVQVQNDPTGSRLRLGRSSAYWRSRMKALAWSAAWSTQFEVGPLSQASLGNVGLHGKQTYVDLVMTPTAGIGLLVAEDALDRYVIEKLERRSRSVYVRVLSRMALNPTRTAANLLRFKKPWHRDPGLR